MSMDLPDVHKRLLRATGLWLLMASVVCGEVVVKTEQLNPADPAWHFKTIPGPSKSDIAQNASVTLVGNEWHTGGGGGAALVNGQLPTDPSELAEEAWLSNENTRDGTIILDLGKVQPVAAVKNDHHSTTRMSTLRGPSRSPSQPVGISNNA